MFVGIARRLLRCAQWLDEDALGVGFARKLLRKPFDIPLRERWKWPERRADDAAEPRLEKAEIFAQKIDHGSRRLAREIRVHHLGDFFEEPLAVAVRRVGAVATLDPPDSGELRIDVIQLVNHRVELRNPWIRARIKTFLARSIERLIAEPRKRERDHVLDRPRTTRDRWRFGDEPFRSARDALRRAIAPEVITGFAGRKRQAMTGRESTLGVRAP